MERSVLPVYVKLSQIIVGLIGFFFILYIGRDILIPLTFATLFAILLNPLVNFLERKGVNRVIAIALALLLGMLIGAAIFVFLSYQISHFAETFPQLKGKFEGLLKDASSWISETFNVSQARIEAWIEKNRKEGLSNTTAMIGQTLTTLSSVLVVVFLLPVYMFMILFYKPLLLDFISQLFSRRRHKMVAEVLTETKGIIQNYLSGLMIEMVIVAIMNSAVLLLLGIQYAILIGVVGALLNLIPYIGGVIAIALPIIVALATKSPSYVLLVIGAYLVVQFIDNNFLVPKIVASKVKMNALASIVVVFVGGALWGVAGMFLALPLTAIAKVTFDRIPALAPFGFLLGDSLPPIGKTVFTFHKPEKKKEKPTS
jgi:predicted PurR-regulated permease PerM